MSLGISENVAQRKHTRKSDCADFFILVRQSFRFSSKICLRQNPNRKTILILIKVLIYLNIGLGCSLLILFSFLTVTKKKCFYVLFPFSYINSTSVTINNNYNNFKSIHFVCVNGNIIIFTTTLNINQTKYDNVENLFFS